MTQQTHNQENLSATPQFIGEFEIDATTLCISRQGLSSKLEPKTMALLLYLARRPGTVISREELEREVWSGMVVGYDALNNTIAKLRKAFGDDSRNPQFIRTVPKVGYQLIAEVRQPARIIKSQSTVLTSPVEPSLERKLAAILSTDVVNYSRLTGLDEEGTHRELSACLDLIKSLVENFNGQVVNSAGDAILAEFATVSDALGCAIVAQKQLAARCEAVQDDRKMRFRIGLNLGEVIVDRNDIYGDGVIVAARLEGLSEPGGICVSGSVFDAIGNKLPLDFEFLGERIVKNVEKPVRAYRAWLKPGATITLPRKSTEPLNPLRAVTPRIAVITILLLITGLGSWAGWHYLNLDHARTKVSERVVPYSGESSIAVLPFENISDDPAQEYFADGMTDDLIADLLKISRIKVIARQSVFAYKDKPIGVEQIAKELGVHYVLEGSVKQFGGKIRVNANLIDTTNTRTLWSERYESDATELFDLQNRVIGSIVEILELKLTDQEKSTLASLPTDNLEAYDYYQRAERRRLVAPNPGRLKEIYSQDSEAIELYSQAIELDPEFTEAYAGLALAALEIWEFASTQVLPSEVARKLAYDSASKVRQLDPENSVALSVLAILQVTDGQHDIAIQSARQAVELDPGSSNAYATLGKVLMYAGEHPEALASVKSAFELDPAPPDSLIGLIGLAEFFNGNYQQALLRLENARKVQHSQHDLLMVYGELDKRDEARRLFDDIRLLTPFANLGHYRIRYAHYKREQDLEYMIATLRKAGVPENAYGFEGSLENKLGATELEALIIGNAWVGVDHLGSDFIQQVTDNGGIAFRNSTSMLVGNAWVDGDQFCVRFSADLLGRDDCGSVYRNPNGTADERNEYVRVALGNLYYFSLK